MIHVQKSLFCVLFLFCLRNHLSKRKVQFNAAKHTAGWRCQNTDHVPAAKTRRRVALSAVCTDHVPAAKTGRRVALSAVAARRPPVRSVRRPALRLQDVGMSAKWTNFRATGYATQSSNKLRLCSAYARRRLLSPWTVAMHHRSASSKIGPDGRSPVLLII